MNCVELFSWIQSWMPEQDTGDPTWRYGANEVQVPLYADWVTMYSAIADTPSMTPWEGNTYGEECNSGQPYGNCGEGAEEFAYIYVYASWSLFCDVEWTQDTLYVDLQWVCYRRFYDGDGNPHEFDCQGGFIEYTGCGEVCSPPSSDCCGCCPDCCG